MKTKTSILLAVLFSMTLSLAACVSNPSKHEEDPIQYRSENPRSILVVPAINKSVVVDAPNYFLSSISYPLAERGYYVFPVLMVQSLMNDDGLSDADMVHSSNPVLLANLFGADSVLYVSIDKCEAKYILLQTSVSVDLSYVLKSGKTGATLWKYKETRFYNSNPHTNVGGIGLIGLVAQLVADSVSAAAERAAPDYMPLMRGANNDAVFSGLPAGPYDSLYLRDGKYHRWLTDKEEE